MKNKNKKPLCDWSFLTIEEMKRVYRTSMIVLQGRNPNNKNRKTHTKSFKELVELFLRIEFEFSGECCHASGVVAVTVLL